MVEKLREREALEKRLYEAEHLSKVGQLASGIAHEIRNPLNYISLAIDHLKSEMLPVCGERRRSWKSSPTRSRRRFARPTTWCVNFMNYGRPLKLRLTSLSYPDLIDKAMPVLQDKLTEQHIEVVTELAPDLPPMLADRSSCATACATS